MKKIFIKNKIEKRNKGFTLVETLVAISIFTISVLGMVSILSNGITDTEYAKDKVIATYLAQEGIEYVRNIRDENILFADSQGWSNFQTALVPCVPSTGLGCGMTNNIDKTAINFFQCINPVDCELYINQGSGEYHYDVGGSSGDTDSGFNRVISTKFDPSTDRVTVYSVVSWNQKSGPQNVTFSESLFNWY
ncbi:MAG: prepilin-type N-terminal cleavage/methylation domain-containing protein [Candidatus Nomurabacteria bacterium]|nr:prepilin-type N-terminal cleavage/methylation domain-containing protein [Candidatus Nomurabacteria bacterium]